MKTSRLNLAWGTNELPELKPYWHKWMQKAQQHDIFRPAGFLGSENLRTAIIDRYKKQYSFEDLKLGNVTITNGGTEALYTAFQWIKSIDGCVIIQQPSWGYFKDALKLLKIPYFESYTKSAIQLKKELQDIPYSGPKLFLLTHPSNPEGHIFDEAYLNTLSEWVHAASDHYMLSDEIYDWYASANDGFRSWTEVHGIDSSIVVEGYSKPTGLAAHRIGYFLSADKMTRSLQSFHMHTTYGVSSLSNAIAFEAQQEEENIRQLLESSLKQRRIIIRNNWSAPKKLLKIPNVGMYVIIRMDSFSEKQSAFFKKLEEKYEIMVTPASAFGCQQGGMRLNLCRPIEILEEAIPIISEQIQKKDDTFA